MTPAANSPPTVRVEEFAGPLDLLFHEVRRQNVAIENVAIAPLAARFLDYMHTATERNLNLDIEWVHMAATLIHWKSRSLLPDDLEAPPKPDPIRDEIIAQLKAHRQKAAEELTRRRSVEQTRFSREALGEFPPGAEIDQPEDSAFVSVWDLVQQARELGRWAGEQRAHKRHSNQTYGIEPEQSTVSQMIDYLQSQLAASSGLRIDGISLLADQPNASRRSCLFLAMLETARTQQITIEQRETFGPMWLESRSSRKTNDPSR